MPASDDIEQEVQSEPKLRRSLGLASVGITLAGLPMYFLATHAAAASPFRR